MSDAQTIRQRAEQAHKLRRAAANIRAVLSAVTESDRTADDLRLYADALEAGADALTLLDLPSVPSPAEVIETVLARVPDLSNVAMASLLEMRESYLEADPPSVRQEQGHAPEKS